VVYAEPGRRGAFQAARARLRELLARLREPVAIPADTRGTSQPADSQFGQAAYHAAVEKAKRYVFEGDIMQVVPSQRMVKPFRATPLALYRALRTINPSPYMYYFDMGDFHVVGASPEILARLEGDTVTVRPIAGTRRRGSAPAEDAALEKELLADEKERAEHIMLVDLGRNDVGRVARTGSVRVTEQMVVERYSHVMHIVSNVEGKLKPGLNAVDVLRASFPAGTVSGAPKVRAMEIIDELEPVKRGIYAGAVGYVVGELGSGFKQMMEMVNGSRLSNAMRAAGIMRRALLESLVHARQRVAFGRPLVELPLLRSNLLSMLLDAEAAASVILNGAALLDRRDAGSAEARALARLWTPLAKYWITLRARDVTAEAMNVRGGNGYVEEWVNPRLLRDAYLGAIWEGSANVVALDVQRAIVKDSGLEALVVFMAERLARVTEPAAKPWVDLVKGNLETVTRQTAGWAAQPAAERELGARPVADTLYHLLAGSLLLAEGQLLREQGRGYRKLLAAGLYLKRWLESRAPASPPFTARQIEWLEPLADWRPIAAAALADVD